MVVVAQLVRALDCGSRCRGFESHLPPQGHDNSHDVNIIKSTSGRLIERLDAHSH